MIGAKTCLVLSVLVAVAYGKMVTVKNTGINNLVANVNGDDRDLPIAGVINVDVTDSLVMTAVPANAEVTDGPRTTIEITLGASDSYAVNLRNGFNLGVKIVPTGGNACSPSVCAANLLNACPAESQVTNSAGAVVACQNSPLAMLSICPLAVEQTCVNATSYLVLFV